VNQELIAWAAIRILQVDPDYLIVLNSSTQLERAAGLGLPRGKPDPDDVLEACTPLQRAAPTLLYTSY